MQTISRLSPLILTLVSACGGATAVSAFSPSFPDNQAEAVRAASREVAASADAHVADIGVAITENGLVGFESTTGSIRFRNPIVTDVPIVLAGNRAFVESHATLHVLDLASGMERTTLSLRVGEHLLGAGSDASLAAISLLSGEGANANGRLVLLEGDDVSKLLDLARPIGVPAVAGNRVLVPWAFQNLSILDLNGNETARIRVRNSVIGHAIAAHGRVFYGASSLYLFGPQSATENPEGFELPAIDLANPPTLLPNAYEPPALITSAEYKVRLAFAPNPGSDSPAPADDTVYLVNFRHLFALDSTTGAPRWAAILPADAVGVRASVGGVRVATEDGEIATYRAADGRVLARVSIGQRVSAVTFPCLESIAAGRPIDREPPTLRAQLVRAVQIADARLVSGREYSLVQLAKLEDAEATADIATLCEDSRLPDRTRRKACELLSTRRTGVNHIESQLRRHGSFLDDEAHPPVGALARASASIGATSAGPLLVEQLRDPRTPLASVSEIARALVVLRFTDAVPSLGEFVRTYHADSSHEGMLDAIGAVAEAYALLGDEDAANEVIALSHDPLSSYALSAALRQAGERAQRALSAPATRASATSTAAEPAEVPSYLTTNLAAPILATSQTGVEACLAAEPELPRSARVILVVRRDGTVAEVLALTPSLTACLSETLLPLRFPETRGTGSTVRFTTTVRAR